MSSKLWFRAKRCRYGWVPCSWEGLLTLAVYVAVLVLNFRRIDSSFHSTGDTLRQFVIQFIIATFIFLFITYSKGEKLGWRWGDKK